MTQARSIHPELVRQRLRVQTLEERATPAIFAVGSGASLTVDTSVKVFDDAGVFKTEFKPFTNGIAGTFFRGGAEVATGDFNNDGIDDVIVGAGPGGGPHVKVYSGVDIAANSTNPAVLYETFAFDATFNGGLHVGAGDVDGDGFDDIIVGAGAGGGPHVKVFSGAGTNPLLMSYFAYAGSFLGGVTVAGGDIGGDITTDEIITGTGAGIASNVRVYNFVANSNVELSNQKIADFAGYDPSFTGGIYVASGKTSNNRDTSNFLYADIITSAGQTGGPHVKVYRLLDALYNAAGQPENWRFFEAGSFYAYTPTFLGGVRVGVVNHGAGGLDDIITSAGVNGGPHVRLFNQTTIGDLVTYAPSQRTEFYAFDPTFIGGTFVG